MKENNEKKMRDNPHVRGTSNQGGVTGLVARIYLSLLPYLSAPMVIREETLGQQTQGSAGVPWFPSLSLSESHLPVLSLSTLGAHQ